MKKEAIILLLILIVAYGCAQGASKAKTAEERLAEGDYTDKTTDHMVAGDYEALEQNIDILLQAGNMIGDRHYDELEAEVNKLEREGKDVSKLREKLAKLAVYSRTEENNKIEISDAESKIRDLENQFSIVKQNEYQVSPEGYAEIERKIKEGGDIKDSRVDYLKQEFSKLKVGGTQAAQQNENPPQNNQSPFKMGLMAPRGCEGNGSFLL